MKNATEAGRKKNKNRDPIIGIGASDGGLSPLTAIIDGLPVKFYASVVFMQRLPADIKEPVQKAFSAESSTRPIIEIADAMPIENGKVYVNPSDHDVLVKAGHFHLRRSPKNKAHFPIDALFTSIAEEAQDAAIAVVLSGTGTDGARGIREVQCKGGAVLVQDPATAEYAAMPRSAVEAGNIDEVLAPENIAKRIVSLTESINNQERVIDISEQAELNYMFNLLHEKTGYGFEYYKKNVVVRRALRRMSLHGLSNIGDYRSLLDKDPAEIGRLASDLMIGVTGFFRDPGAWESLNRNVINKLIADKKTSESIRVWTPGCSTGEEAYSIAMMLMREMESSGKKNDVHVFATDINEKAIAFARRGEYPSNVATDIPADYLKAFFTSTEDGLHVRINKYLRRDHVVFAKQNLLVDPPFSKLDLLICRNLFIYLEPEFQDKCISIFHYALKENGYLFLGNAESIGRRKGLFKSLGDKGSRLYQRMTRTKPFHYSFPAAITPKAAPGAAPESPAISPDNTMTEFAREALLSLQTSPKPPEAAAMQGPEAERPAIRKLECELSAVRDELQTTIEELRCANEEMQASNEELETSREELQSLNEELVTANAQLQTKIEEQESTNDDLNNFFSSADIPTLFLDQAFNVRRFTPAMTGLINLIPSDVGRSISDMSIARLGLDLLADARAVFDRSSPMSREIPVDGAWYIRSTLPYKTGRNRIEGVVITFVNITGRKEIELELQKRQIELDSLFNNSNAGLVLFDAQPPYTVIAHNKYYQELFVEPFRTKGMVGRNIFEYSPEVKTRGVAAIFDEVVKTKKAVDLPDFPYDSHPPAKSWFNWHLSPIIHDGKVVALASISINNTDKHMADEEIKRSAEELKTINEELTRFNRAAVGRELRMVELKREVNELNKLAGQQPRYNLDFAEKGIV